MGAVRDLPPLPYLAPNDDLVARAEFGFKVRIAATDYTEGTFSNNGWLAFCTLDEYNHGGPSNGGYGYGNAWTLNFTPMDFALVGHNANLDHYAYDLPPIPIVSPFFGDVDTRSDPIGNRVTYGPTVYQGRRIWAATWDRVGYFNRNFDLRNTFQLIVFEQPNSFHIECNVDQVQWDTGDASNGQFGHFRTDRTPDPHHQGYDGDPAMAGIFIPPRHGQPVFRYYVPGSFVPDALLDGSPHALTRQSYKSTVPGRYIYGSTLSNRLRLAQRQDDLGVDHKAPRIGHGRGTPRSDAGANCRVATYRYL